MSEVTDEVDFLLENTGLGREELRVMDYETIRALYEQYLNSIQFAEEYAERKKELEGGVIP